MSESRLAEPILVGDVGGTHTRLAVFDGNLGPVWSVSTPGSGGLASTMRVYLETLDEVPQRSCVAVAGPVGNGVATLTNVDWRGCVDDLPGHGTLLNDLEAAAWSLGSLKPEDQVSIGPVVVGEDGPAVVLGVGTGFGQAMWTGTAAVAGEGGHAGFAPTCEETMRLWEMLHRESGRVRIEDVLSGPGLDRVLDFVSKSQPVGPAATEQRRFGPPGSAIGEHWDTDPACREAVRLFGRVLGSVAGDAALEAKATGGVWLMGGVITHLLEAVVQPQIREAFDDKGPMGGLMSRIPLRVITHPHPVLLGAAAYGQSAPST